MKQFPSIMMWHPTQSSPMTIFYVIWFVNMYAYQPFGHAAIPDWLALWLAASKIKPFGCACMQQGYKYC